MTRSFRDRAPLVPVTCTHPFVPAASTRSVPMAFSLTRSFI